jgi:E3 ubiquitin-protein ligase HUWE1
MNCGRKCQVKMLVFSALLNLPVGISFTLFLDDTELWADLPGLNKLFRDLVSLHTKVTLLSDIAHSASFPHGRGGNAIVHNFVNSDVVGIIPELGSLHRNLMVENLVLNRRLGDLGIVTEVDEPPYDLAKAATSGAHSSENRPTLDQANTTPEQLPAFQQKNISSPASKNAKAISYIGTQLPLALQTLFQGKLLPFMHKYSRGANLNRRSFKL